MIARFFRPTAFFLSLLFGSQQILSASPAISPQASPILRPIVNEANPQDQMGVALLPDQIQVQPERVLDSNIAKLIQGAFCGWDDFLIAVIITAVISGAVQAITATSGNFVVNFLKGFAFGAITSAITFGIGAVLSGFASGVNGIASGILQGIKTFVAPIVNGFKVLGSAVWSFHLERISDLGRPFLRRGR